MSKSETNLAWLRKRKEVIVSEAKYSKKNMEKDEVRGRKGLDCVVACKM